MKGGAQRSRTRQRLYKKFKQQCFFCQEEILYSQATIDHLVPRSKGGTDDETNLVLACRTCNIDKGSELDLDRVQFRKLDIFTHIRELFQ